MESLYAAFKCQRDITKNSIRINFVNEAREDMKVIKRVGLSVLLMILTLFSIQSGAYALTSEKLLKTTTTWDGNPIPSQNIKDPQVTVMRFTVKPGETLHVHYHPVLNVAYIVSGSLTLIKPGTNQKKRLEAGDSFAEVINQWHYGKNMGNTNLVLVVFYLGEKGEPITILKATPLERQQ